MIAVNSLTDRVMRLAATSGVTQQALYGDDAPLGAFRVSHKPIFESYSCDVDGQLSYELASYLKMLKQHLRVKGDIGFTVTSRSFWDRTQCFLRFELFEHYMTQEEADERHRFMVMVRNTYINEHLASVQRAPLVRIA